ncbi:MAG: L,D-transpeptidase, partial [Verrucomicrobia bacterium]|nr:L,D-transpeptidase [Verrucomicrobiota bacterium]
GLGCELGSFKTPTGLFRICEKIGDGNPAETVYRGRKPVGDIDPSKTDADLIMSRILWLDGREPHNANTRSRFIYIHGTNQAELVGSPASHGCIRMRNADVIELFEIVDVGTEVEIVS